MFQYLLSRVIGIIPTLLVLILTVVLMIRFLPGNAVDIMLQEQSQAQSTTKRELEKRLGLDKSIPEAFVAYSLGALRGDLGRSVWSGNPVLPQIMSRLPVSLAAGVFALVFSTVVGVAVGVLAAVRQGSMLDLVTRSITVLGLSIPNFALATLIIVMPVIFWSWSPLTVYQPVSAGVLPWVRQFILPGIILGIGPASTLMRLSRTQMLEVMRQDYIRTARAKGLKESAVIWGHALRNSLIPVVTLVGLQVANIVGGAVVIETVFGLPGIGLLLINSIATRDYPLIQGITVLVGIGVTVTFLLVDMCYGWLDPRASLVA